MGFSNPLLVIPIVAVIGFMFLGAIIRRRMHMVGDPTVNPTYVYPPAPAPAPSEGRGPVLEVVCAEKHEGEVDWRDVMPLCARPERARIPSSGRKPISRTSSSQQQPSHPRPSSPLPFDIPKRPRSHITSQCLRVTVLISMPRAQEKDPVFAFGSTLVPVERGLRY
ncbi:hypothetical protein BXZ70DRAFT_544302 [Cristinia sonorae]|uniref:Uncharacterized protein n=1 Tax=Cristinia sonorae TaxID=1940300 RepID=A0A8K0XLC4_9AGAR|nr:hypothetical protein BXZ70DRAFT_544302 [Cristinia sonorae]